MTIEINNWLDDDSRFTRLQSEITASLELLEYAGCLNKVLNIWVRREALKEAGAGNTNLEVDSDKKRLLNWCNNKWGTQVNEMFLEKKEFLDVISFNMVRIHNHAVALEVYHRLKGNEASFQQLSNLFSVESDRQSDPLKTNQRIGSLPVALQKILRSMKPGQLSKPISLNSVFLICRVEKIEPAEFSESIKEKLLLDQFSAWASSVAGVALDRLR